MNTLLLGINSKYIHTNLAIYYLKANIISSDYKVFLKEYSINDHEEKVLDYILEKNIKVVAVSCYIWNIAYIERLIRLIKEIDKEIIIIAGGPEISFSNMETVEQLDEIDYIIRGEGEESLGRLLDAIYFKDFINLKTISGLVYKDNGKYIENKWRGNINFDNVIFPYTKEILKDLENKIVYYESSRGCPYKCSYCLSANDNNIRFRNIEKVKKELMFFIGAGIKLVKFVDRTFNINKERTKEIFRFLIDNCRNTRFHFEINADILDDDTIQLLNGAPKGLFQFEIGIQSINFKTLEAINRNTNIDILLDNLSKLLEPNNIHIHTDLIVGLPKEDFNSFVESFNTVYKLRSNYIQLGFLKLLKGTSLERELSNYNYKFKSNPPYEIISNSYLSQKEILKLKGIEEVLMKFYNSKRFQFSLDYLTTIIDSFKFYNNLYEFLREKDLVYEPQSPLDLYKELQLFCINQKFNMNILREKLKLDFIISNKSKQIPEFLIENGAEIEIDKNCIHDFFNNQDIIKKYIPQYLGVPVKKIIKNAYLYKFISLKEKYILVDYMRKNQVTEQYYFYDVTLYL